VLRAGERIPEGKVWLAPREPAPLLDLVEDAPTLFLFFLFAWSST
jgi:hypothetical protein